MEDKLQKAYVFIKNEGGLGKLSGEKQLKDSIKILILKEETGKSFKELQNEGHYYNRSFISRLLNLKDYEGFMSIIRG